MINFPFLETNNKDINTAYRLAVANLSSNILPFKDGILENEKPVIIAGLGYNTPWTRDAAINTWNAGGLICPEIALDTLKSVLNRNENGYFIDGEYWDKIIWTIGAWWYYIYNGDNDFLKISLNAVDNSLKQLKENEFSEEFNLFRGPACYGDGVAAYPDVYATHGKSGIISFASDNKDLCEKSGVGIPIYSLSTNCLYYYAYVLADKMADELELSHKYEEEASRMKEAINKTFWNDKKGNYNYIFDKFGGCDSQEGIGVSFAILFDVADDDKKNKIFKNQFISKYGIPCVYPSFSRYNTYDGMGFGRHSGTVWPHVQGFWADAASNNNKTEIFDNEFKNQTDNALRYLQFAEIYHPITGEMYGGLQEDKCEGIRYWRSEPYQTWSATAYLRNVYMDLLGMKFGNNGIAFNPVGSTLTKDIKLKNLIYRKSVLNISVNGTGTKIKSFKLDGKEHKPFISNDILGEHNIEIILF